MSSHPGKPTDDEQDSAAEAFYGVETSSRMTLDDVALRIFCALLIDAKVSLYPSLAEQQVRVAFEMAETFLKVSEEKGKEEA